MSEEQPIFKVTDRRLFNPDGTPREIEREEETKTETPAGETKQAAPANESAAAAASSQAGEATRESAQPAPAPNASPAQTTRSSAVATNTESEAETATGSSVEDLESEQLPEDDYEGGDIPGADDPASFINFLMSIASNAAASLGMMEHPVTGERRVDPELAKHWIDILGMLQQKTRGNLVPQEQQIFEGLLADLRMQYVSLSGARQPNTPRGFSGSDITGGR
jgi:hypothetical protein